MNDEAWWEEFLDAIEKSGVRPVIWFCPDRAHRERVSEDGRPLPTVAWIGGTAHCLTMGCSETSEKGES